MELKLKLSEGYLVFYGENNMNKDLFEGLNAVVQYRRKDGDDIWRTMAAFDVESMADKYCADCSAANSTWEYRVVPVRNR